MGQSDLPKSLAGTGQVIRRVRGKNWTESQKAIGADWASDLPKSLAETAQVTLTAEVDSRGGKRAENPNSKKRSLSPLQTPQYQSQEPRPSLREFHSQSNTKSKEESKTTKKTKSN